MEGPTKRALTTDGHDAIVAANAPRHDLCVPRAPQTDLVTDVRCSISDDLTARLQNVGSRVRKSEWHSAGCAPPAVYRHY